MSAFSTKEQEKLSVIEKAIQGKITNEQAAKQLQLSVRQIKRLKKKVREQGRSAIVHQLKGKQSNHHIAEIVKEKAIQILQEKYIDFTPTFATEKLIENHEITISHGTTRLWMIEKGLWKSRKQKKSIYRSWRQRKDYFGELQQFDGSYHYWLEERFCDQQGNPIEMCLLASIDDATGKITKACFSSNEGIIAVFTFWKEYVITTGKPGAIYLDKFSTYKINHKAAADNKELMTQFQRAMKQLSINLISAHSPQAKGRIERLFKTLQDRLVKELRLANVTTPDEANRFLQEVFIEKYNNKFSVIPAKEEDMHKALQKEEKRELNNTFSMQETRVVNSDYTIQFQNQWYQLTEIQPTTVRPKTTVLMEIWLDGTIHIMLKQYELTYFILPVKPKKQNKQPPLITTHPLNYKPAPTHPWRQYAKIMAAMSLQRG